MGLCRLCPDLWNCNQFSDDTLGKDDYFGDGWGVLVIVTAVSGENEGGSRDFRALTLFIVLNAKTDLTLDTVRRFAPVPRRYAWPTCLALTNLPTI